MTEPGADADARARVLAYLRTRAASLDAPRLRARIRAAAAEFDAAVRDLTEAEARRAAPDGGWSVAQIVDHVAQSTVRGAEELRHLLAGRRPPGPPVYEGLLSGAAHRVPWSELLAGVREASAAVDAVLEPLGPSWAGPAALTVPAILVAGPGAGAPGTPFTAELTWKEYALVLRLHFLDHREQVRQGRAAPA
jgi:hypothetical protein